MDKLKSKRIMVWTFMGNARMYEALRNYGDRIDTIGLFSFKVDRTGTITESGVTISSNAGCFSITESSSARYVEVSYFYELCAIINYLICVRTNRSCE